LALLGVAVVLVMTMWGSAAEAAPPPEAGSWAQVSTGYYHTCAIKLSGQLWCWGQDSRGQLGNGGANTNSALPVQVGADTNWKQVSAGSASTCATKTTGTLWCWGRDDFGQLGNGAGTTGDQSVPIQVGTAVDWKVISVGLGETACGLRANKRIYCWGRDNNGQVGNGPGGFADVLSPVQVAGNHADWTTVSTGGYHVCGRRTNRRLYCWGDDLDGAVGDGGAGVDRSSPVLVAGGFTNWTSVASGITHACGRRANGRLYCWGSDINGGLGNGGANTSRRAPVQVAGAATNWKVVGAGSYLTCATKTNGRLYCWGFDAYGGVGTGVADGIDNRSPAQVAGGATTWKTAVMGNHHTCALRTDSRLFCWGYGFFGQRGDGVSGNNNNQPTPVEVT
jgi:alpha-tubulin suppressor-like RCC1 family protein